MRIARRHREASGYAAPVVVVNAAAGGSGLVAEPRQGTWRVGHRGATPRLYDAAVDALDAAIAAAVERYPVRPEIWLYWHQGEADLETAEEAYADALDELCSSLRDHLGDPGIPFTAGAWCRRRTPRRPCAGSTSNSPPGWSTPPTPTAIRNGGDDLETGAVHYVREAAERLGDAMFDASRRAAIASAASVPHKPSTSVSSTSAGRSGCGGRRPCAAGRASSCSTRSTAAGWTTVPREVPCALDEQIAGVPGALHRRAGRDRAWRSPVGVHDPRRRRHALTRPTSAHLKENELA